MAHHASINVGYWTLHKSYNLVKFSLWFCRYMWDAVTQVNIRQHLKTTFFFFQSRVTWNKHQIDTLLYEQSSSKIGFWEDVGYDLHIMSLMKSTNAIYKPLKLPFKKKNSEYLLALPSSQHSLQASVRLPSLSVYSL